ncbi:substrate-binding domain-containing protein [Actinobacillus pleuropneumoniae]|uniref:substrate-binding domain-containing protein n=1 Tax=Actinobacillus pleuropneumoniae TaxID=715 RepID=UPI003B029F5D
MKKLTSLALALGLVFGTKAMAQDTLALAVSTLDNPFFVTLKEGAEKKAKDLGYKLVVLDSQNDPAKELANVEDLTVRGAKVLLINPTDSEAVGNAVAIANKKNIPVITLDRGANKGEVVSHIASDNVAGGKMAATIAQQPDKIGELGVETADKLLKGEKVEAKIPVPLKVISQ